VRALDLYTSAEPCRCFLAVSYTDAQGTEEFLDAGPIWTHDYDSAGGVLTVAGAGLWSLWDHRKILPVLAAGVNPASITSSFTATLGTIAKQLLQLAMTHTGGAVPVVLPADETGTDTRSYNGYDMAVVGQALRDLTKVDGGPEIQFRPRRTAADPRYLEWVMLTGTTAQPLLVQAGDDLILDHTAPRSQVTSIKVNRDGSKMADRWWTQGSGTDITTLFGRADDTSLIDAGFPLLEGDDNRSDITDQATINSVAAGALAANRRPIDTLTIAVHRDGVQDQSGQWGGPNAASLRVGSRVTLQVGGWVDPVEQTTPREPYLAADGQPRTIRGRIVNVAGDMSTSITLGLAPAVEGAAA
jgi:hypothetical protein